MKTDADSRHSIEEGLQQKLRAFFLSEPKTLDERGCLVLKDGTLVPIPNASTTPRVEIVQDPASFMTMMDLMVDDKVLFWAHSHPQWSPRPSHKDIVNHQLPIDMVIYSIPEDRFLRFTPGDVEQLEQTMHKEPNTWLTTKQTHS